MIPETPSTLRWRVKINVTSSISYETENDLIERGVCSIRLPLCHCASLIHANGIFFNLLFTGDNDQSYVNQRLMKSKSCDS